MITIPVFIYIVCLIPQASIRFFVWLSSKLVYRIRVYGQQNIPDEGGALLVANHVSWLDGILLLLISDRPIRMVVYAGNFKGWTMKWLANMWDAILLPTRPKELVKMMKETRQSMANGDLVCIFPEGGITRTGQMQEFKPGAMKIHEGSGVPIIPVYLDELWGSIFSFERGKFFWKLPHKLRYPVSIHVGPPVDNPEDVHEVRQAVQQLGAQAVQQRTERQDVLPRILIRNCKLRKFTKKIADSSGQDLSGGSVLMRTLILRRLLERNVYESEEQNVGVLLPPSAGGVMVNAAIALSRKTSVNLNYSVSAEVLNDCIAQAGLKHILTSRRFTEKLEKSTGLAAESLDAELVYLEDFKEKVSIGDKLACALAAFVIPSGTIERSLKLHEIDSDEVMTIIFTSGSTGQPKGVMLTHTNVASNVDAIDQVVHLRREDVVLGILPFFHSFGYTVTLWGSLGLDIKGVYHFSPLEPKQVGKLCRQHSGTVFLGTPTFLRSYLRRCKEEDFKTLDIVIAGAEKLPTELSDKFEEKFGVRPVEGYGATELSPLVSVNVPPSRSLGGNKTDAKEGTVGRPIPGVSAKITDLDSGQELGVGQDGMLWIKGPNVMKGYIGRDDLTAEAIKDGWYHTGDVALLDEDGFIQITGRQSRFSKIGGEMVPHIKIEEKLIETIAADDEAGQPVAVTAVPDDRKGERLIVLHLPLDQSPDDLCKALADAGLPNIFIPSQDSFLQVDELPVLGSGKLDLKAIKQVALDHFAK